MVLSLVGSVRLLGDGDCGSEISDESQREEQYTHKLRFNSAKRVAHMGSHIKKKTTDRIYVINL